MTIVCCLCLFLSLSAILISIDERDRSNGLRGREVVVAGYIGLGEILYLIRILPSLLSLREFVFAD